MPWTTVRLALSVLFVVLAVAAPRAQESDGASDTQVTAAGKQAGGTTAETADVYMRSTILASRCKSGLVEKADVTRTENRIPKPVQQILLAWLEWSLFWRHVFYGLSFTTLLFGALATALHDDTNRWWSRWKTMAAIITTVSAGLTTTVLPYAQHKRFDNAFAVLNTAKLFYLTNPDFSECDLGKAVGYGEALIHQNN